MHIPRTNKTTISGINEAGFTLVELMIAMFVSGLVMAAVVSVFISQSKNFTQHDDIAGIQQNLRGALAILAMEIRLAGCDPEESKIPAIRTATRSLLQFTRDIRGHAVQGNSADGDVNDPDENIAYQLTGDPDGDGIVGGAGTPWSGIGTLGRQTGGGGGFQPLADNVEALEFNYILADGTTSLAPAQPNEIRAVQVSLLARASNPAEGYLHTGTYTTASGAVWTPPADQFRRRLAITTIQSRNMGY